MQHPPFFVIGASRSGTTLLRLMLNAHSMIAVPHETNFFSETVPLAVLRAWPEAAMEPEAFDHMIDRWLNRCSYSFKPVGIDRVRRSITEAAPNVADAYRRAMALWAQHYGKQCWGEKTPEHLYYVDFIASMFPKARFVYIVRDPRAVVRSMNAIEFFSADSVINAYNWKQAATEGWQLFQNHVPVRRRLLLHYESLVQHPEETLRALCDFLEVSYEPDMLSFYQLPDSVFPENVRTPNIQRPINAESLDKWRNELSDRQVASVEAVCREPMGRFGYVPENIRLDMVGRINFAVKTAYWFWKKRRSTKRRGFTIKYTPFARFRPS